MKKYTLLHYGGNRFALANETDADPMHDYCPGIWAIESQKEAARWCRQLLNEGNEVSLGFGDANKLQKVISQI